MDVELAEQAEEIAGPADRDRRGGDAVLEHQHPADEPGRELAEGGVGVGVGAAGDRHHRGELGIGQCAEGAADRGQHEGQHDGRASVVGGGLAGDDEDAAADHRADTEGGQAPGAEVAAQAQAVGVFMGGMRVLGGPQLLEHVWWSCRSAPRAARGENGRAGARPARRRIRATWPACCCGCRSPGRSAGRAGSSQRTGANARRTPARTGTGRWPRRAGR